MPPETPETEPVLDVITNTLHGWHNPSCAKCRERAEEVLSALTGAGFTVAHGTAPEPPAPLESQVARAATCEHAALRPRCARDLNGRCVMCCAHYHFFSED